MVALPLFGKEEGRIFFLNFFLLKVYKSFYYLLSQFTLARHSETVVLLNSI